MRETCHKSRGHCPTRILLAAVMCLPACGCKLVSGGAGASPLSALTRGGDDARDEKIRAAALKDKSFPHANQPIAQSAAR